MKYVFLFIEKIVFSNFDLPVLACLFCTELANKMQEEQEEVESSANLNIQSQVPPSHCAHEEHISDLSLSDDPPAEETPAEKSSEYTPDDYSTWNGKRNIAVCKYCPKFTSQWGYLSFVVPIAGVGPGEEMEEDDDDEDVPENAWWEMVVNSPLCITVADHHSTECCQAMTARVQAPLLKHSSWLNVVQWQPKGPQTLSVQLTMKISH